MSLKRGRPLLTCFLLSWAILLTVGSAEVWAAPRVAVFYPKVEEPYFSIFQSILKGIDAQLGAAARPYPLPDDFDAEALQTWLKQEQIQSIIALGKQGCLAAKAAGNGLPVTVGALPTVPDNLPGISLAPDPNLLFRQLKGLAPQVERVHVVYSEASDWLIKWAEAAARARGLQLSAYPASDLRQAVHHYRNLLDAKPSRAEAIWLPLDNITSNDEVVLPMLLQAAWDKNLVLFSSKPSHAQRGALFSMFPDHVAMGRSLAEMALNSRAGTNAGAIPVANLQLAVNLRTAAHLGLRFSPRQQERFDLVFPSQ